MSGETGFNDGATTAIEKPTPQVNRAPTRAEEPQARASVIRLVERVSQTRSPSAGLTALAQLDEAPGIRLNKPPQILRQFSRQQSPEERQALAAQIKDKRGEHFREKAKVAGKESQLRKTAEELARTEEAISEIPDSWFGRALNYRRLRQLREKGENLTSANEQIQDELSAMAYTEARLTEQGLPVTRLDQAKDLVNKFYESEAEKWTNTEYSREDIEKYFTEEYLSSLSMEDYILLLRRFPSDMVAHVTRQGIRDHTGIDEHTAGTGQFSDGFTQIVSDGRLRSSIGAYTKNGVSEEVISTFLESFVTRIGSQDDAVTVLNNIVYGRAGGEVKYPDSSAVHFAVGTVADAIYGAERGNEIFFAFPTAHIAAHNFYGGRSQISEQHVGMFGFKSDWNDVSVWSENNEGISINAGLVFIPADAPVDSATGSRYAIDAQRKPLERTDNIEALSTFVNSPGFSEVIHLQSELEQSHSVSDEENSRRAQLIDSFKTRLSQEFGIQDPKLQDAIANYKNIVLLVKSIPTGNPDHDMSQLSPDEAVKKVLLQEGLLYQEATDTISSQEYWENYFRVHPDKRPKRIIYYEGGDPTQALLSWREENGLDKRSDDNTFGFPDRQISSKDPRANQGYDRFKSLAKKVLKANSRARRLKKAA